MIRYSENASQASLSTVTAEGIRIHERADDMPNLPIGRFARMPTDERIFALACGFPARGDPGAVFVSSDEGETWVPTGAFSPDGSLLPTDSGAFTITAQGTLIAAFSNGAEKSAFSWDPVLKDCPGARLPTYVTRSLDGGQTWQDTQKLHDEWTGANRDMLQAGEMLPPEFTRKEVAEELIKWAQSTK